MRHYVLRLSLVTSLASREGAELAAKDIGAFVCLSKTAALRQIGTRRIKKELSICQSLPCLDLVSFPVLSQIKPAIIIIIIVIMIISNMI